MKMLLLTTAFLLLCAAAVNGDYIPAECVKDFKRFPAPCCPLYQGSPCGRDLGRGNCLATPTSRTEAAPPTDVNTDDRLNRASLFNMTCQCKPNFMGYKCHECYFGWKGDNCNIRHTVIRRDVKNLTSAEVQKFIATFHYCKHKIDPVYVILASGDRLRYRSYHFVNASYYDNMAFIHHYATQPTVVNGVEVYGIRFAHGSTAFLTWHCLYLLLLERSIQRCIEDPDFALVYWKWEDEPNGQCSVCNDKYFGDNDYSGKISPYSVFSEWRLICELDYSNTLCITEECPCQRAKLIRMVGLSYTRLPSAADINRCYNLRDVDLAPFGMGSVSSYRPCIEYQHNAVHVYLGGAMTLTRIAACDIMFVLHHANMDRMNNVYYARWGITPDSYPPNNLTGHTPYGCMEPFHVCYRARDFMTLGTNLGYRYV